MRYENLLFDENETYERLGDRASVNKSYEMFREPVDYFLKSMENYPTDVSHDVFAAEPPFFQTINYTTYSKCLIMAPLQPDLAKQQMIDSMLSYEDDGIDYIDFFKQQVKKNTSNKYNEIQDRTSEYNCEALVVLPGGNKLFTEVCFNKLKYILKEHGKLAVFKPHPLTAESDIEEFRKFFGKAGNPMTIADPFDDLYKYMEKAKIIYTSHLSESALYAKCLGKEISPIDAFQRRNFQSFSHINDFLFMIEDIKIVNKMFSNYRSGVIIPELHSDWQYRIDSYLNYIHTKRGFVKNYYV